METVALADTGRSTSRLGFGCSTLMGASSRSQSLAVLEAAFDAGIRHFDVAPLYGYGAAEGCLGEFLARHPGLLTVTTKYGIPPARNQSLLGIARSLARPVVKLLPGAKQRLAKLATSVSGPTLRASFTPNQAETSLNRSLAELRTDHIDCWLLHEVEPEELRDDSLLRFLEQCVASGKIGTFGTGSGRDKVQRLKAEAPAYCRVMQFEWSVLDPVLPADSSFRIHHRALTSLFPQLHAKFVAESDLCRNWSSRVGADLADKHALAALMLKASLSLNPTSVILFSSKNPEHIQRNVDIAQDGSLTAPAIRLHDLIQAEGLSL
jgi:aryl-alcohol dehydrogenase-like predicted oxidoreductase